MLQIRQGTMPERIFVGMSGGVDSSVTACLLKEQGWEVIGGTMQLIDERLLPPGAENCGARTGAADAKIVAEQLGISHCVFDFRTEFRSCVLARFADGYRCGQTPNPCVDCNHFLKFGLLRRAARESGADCIATGHYARRSWDGARWLLQKGADPARDQSYFLCRMPREALAHVRFPLGEMTKTEVRTIARERGLAVAEKRDSQDICFVPDGDYTAFLERFTGDTGEPGDFVDAEGRVIGRHRGHMHYTIGQRRGLEFSAGHRVYVTGKDAEKNIVYLGENADLFAPALEASDLNLLACDTLTAPIRCTAKIRSSRGEAAATAEQTGENTLRVRFDEPQRAITPGQAVVLYDGDIVIGGATITRALPCK